MPEQFELTDTSIGLADDLPGFKKGPDQCLGCAQASDEGIAGIQHMNDLGCSFTRELFLWNGMQGGWDPDQLPKIATDRNFRTTKEVIGLVQFTPHYAGGALTGNDRFNVPNGLKHAPWDPRNTWGQALHGVVGSRLPSEQEYGSFPTASLIFSNQTLPYEPPSFDWHSVAPIPRDAALNPVNRWIIGNEWDICQEDMPGFSFRGSREDAYRMCAVAYQAAKAANPNCEMLFPAVMQPVFDQVSDPIERIFGVLKGYRQMLLLTECTKGCPIGNIALELADSHSRIRMLCAENFDGWLEAIRGCLDDASNRLPDTVDHTELASFVLSVMEGAVMQARAYRMIEPYD
ncbi:MAG: TetR family transcriptional regulator C-terminal domain-containing protein, partial [Chloroflexi bacterium]|nr:TetR family transcriptional regulator C-terminal domain-containing protein [Chloroflexota bacterium]